jgi:hypothetical protein
MLDAFVKALEGNAEVDAIKAKVAALATSFAMPGFDPALNKYKL